MLLLHATIPLPRSADANRYRLSCSNRRLRNKSIHAAAILVKALAGKTTAISSSDHWNSDDVIFAAAAAPAAADVLNTLQKERTIDRNLKAIEEEGDRR